MSPPETSPVRLGGPPYTHVMLQHGPPADHILLGAVDEVMGLVSLHLMPEAPARRQDAGRERASARTARLLLAGPA